MKILKIIVILIVILIVVAAGRALMGDGNITVERSATMNASAENIFSQVNSLKDWTAWSPWHEIDPNTAYEYSGSETGVGSVVKWNSDNNDVGAGMQEITATEPHKSIDSKLSFGENGEMGTANGTFKFEEVGEGTKVTWSADMSLGLLERMMMLDMMMDGML